jgi:hypothetical protein
MRSAAAYSRPHLISPRSSPADDLALLSRWADRTGIEVTLRRWDPAEGDWPDGSPGLQDLLEAAHAGTIDFLLLRRREALSRDAGVCAAVQDEFERAGVPVLTPDLARWKEAARSAEPPPIPVATHR